MPHAVSRLRAARLARSSKPFLARGGPRGERCAACRLVPSHCLCALRPVVPVRAGVCLLMADIEPLKPSNTGWLIADMVADTFAFGWARTVVDPDLLALLADPQWQPYLVFPGEFAAAGRVVSSLLPAGALEGRDGQDGEEAQESQAGQKGEKAQDVQAQAGKRPLFVLLDATWIEARKMFRKSPYLDHLPVLSLHSEQLSRYRLRRSQREHHFCTSEVAALCLELAGEAHAAQTLEAYLDVFTDHYLKAKQQQPVDGEDAAHQRLRGLQLPAGSGAGA
jgi:DTW domain-containing protein YfiP